MSKGDDLIKRLRDGTNTHGYAEVLMDEAADELERLGNKEREQAEALLEGEARGYARVGNLIERLRGWFETNQHPDRANEIMQEAADAIVQCRTEVGRAVVTIGDLEIERIELRERIAELEGALRKIMVTDCCDASVGIAHAALEGKP